jgi:transcription initiation factor IIF auxiliary subunit
LPSLDSKGPPNENINESEINTNYLPSEEPITATTYNVTLMQDGKHTGPNNYFAKVWVEAPNKTLSEISNVTYYLHPTFNPSVIPAYSSDNKFGISFTGWGVFDLRAKVYFKDDEVRDLELPNEKWTFSQ